MARPVGSVRPGSTERRPALDAVAATQRLPRPTCAPRRVHAAATTVTHRPTADGSGVTGSTTKRRTPSANPAWQCPPPLRLHRPVAATQPGTGRWRPRVSSVSGGSRPIGGQQRQASEHGRLRIRHSVASYPHPTRLPRSAAGDHGPPGARTEDLASRVGSTQVTTWDTRGRAGRGSRSARPHTVR